jgi:hypothetical protein
MTPDDRSVCWMLGAEATLLVDLGGARQRRYAGLRLELAVLPQPELALDPAVDDRLLLDVSLNGHLLARRQLPNRYGFRTVGLRIPSPGPWTDGLNTVGLRLMHPAVAAQAAAGGQPAQPVQGIAALAGRPVRQRRLGLTEADVAYLARLESAQPRPRMAVDWLIFTLEGPKNRRP